MSMYKWISVTTPFPQLNSPLKTSNSTWSLSQWERSRPIISSKWPEELQRGENKERKRERERRGDRINQLCLFRVIHLDNWESASDVFRSWTAYAICDFMKASTRIPKRKTTTLIPNGEQTDFSIRRTIPHNKLCIIRTWYVKDKMYQMASSETTKNEPSNVELHALSPTSISVSWTCCTNTKSVSETRNTTWSYSSNQS